jgi:hypothetical protein
VALTKVTTTVLNANAVANTTVANSAVNRSGHVANATIEVQHLADSANTTILNDGVISNVNTVTSNVNTVQDNVFSLTNNVGFLEINSATFLVFGSEPTITGQTSFQEAKTTNGSQNGQGWRLPVAGTATHVTAQFDVATQSSGSVLQVDLYKNGASVATNGNNVVVSGAATGDAGNSNVISTTFAAGDRIMLQFKHSDGTLSTGEHAFVVRYLPT